VHSNHLEDLCKLTSITESKTRLSNSVGVWEYGQFWELFFRLLKGRGPHNGDPIYHSTDFDITHSYWLFHLTCLTLSPHSCLRSHISMKHLHPYLYPKLHNLIQTPFLNLHRSCSSIPLIPFIFSHLYEHPLTHCVVTWSSLSVYLCPYSLSHNNSH
jgi:hypothetical protein